MASYDENNAKAYVLEKGDYVISINSDSHTVLDQKTYTAGDDVVYKGENKEHQMILQHQMYLKMQKAM